jgi:hypothetical protein
MFSGTPMSFETNGQTPKDRNLRSNNIAITKMHITSAITPSLPNSRLKASKLGRTKCLYSTGKGFCKM